MVNGQPNSNPNNPMLTKSNAERNMEKAMKNAEAKRVKELAVMGQVGAQVAVPKRARRRYRRRAIHRSSTAAPPSSAPLTGARRSP